MNGELRLKRLLIAAALCVPMAVVSGLLALSVIAEREQPHLSYALNPFNGNGQARLALSRLTAAADAGDDQKAAAKEVLALARQAYANDPINPRALAAIITATDDKETAEKLIDSSIQINRRSLSLQALALQNHVDKLDVDAAVNTLDQILRVHPERIDDFSPLLVGQLAQEGGVEILARTMQVPAPWHKNFYYIASDSPQALANLAELIRQLSFKDDAMDKRLIVRLSKEGRLTDAQRHYQHVKRAATGSPDEAWPLDYPPFDWRFTDQAKFRAQITRDKKNAEFYVRSGEGGIVMSRIFDVPSTATKLSIRHEIEPMHADKIRLRISCAQTRKVFEERMLDEVQLAGIALGARPADCRYLQLVIYGRAMTGHSAIRGQFNSIRFE